MKTHKCLISLVALAALTAACDGDINLNNQNCIANDESGNCIATSEQTQTDSTNVGVGDSALGGGTDTAGADAPFPLGPDGKFEIPAELESADLNEVIESFSFAGDSTEIENILIAYRDAYETQLADGAAVPRTVSENFASLPVVGTKDDRQITLPFAAFVKFIGLAFYNQGVDAGWFTSDGVTVDSVTGLPLFVDPFESTVRGPLLHMHLGSSSTTFGDVYPGYMPTSADESPEAQHTGSCTITNRTPLWFPWGYDFDARQAHTDGEPENNYTCLGAPREMSYQKDQICSWDEGHRCDEDSPYQASRTCSSASQCNYYPVKILVCDCLVGRYINFYFHYRHSSSGSTSVWHRRKRDPCDTTAVAIGCAVPGLIGDLVDWIGDDN